jgi:hypothetical protein
MCPAPDVRTGGIWYRLLGAWLGSCKHTALCLWVAAAAGATLEHRLLGLLPAFWLELR